MLDAFDPELSRWVALGVGMAIAALLIAARLRYRAMPELKPAAQPLAGAPDCMVVIPARDEAAVIGDCVRSLPPDSAIVVDDHSRDNTAQIARSAGAGVLKAPDLARGAMGKANACAAGAAVITSKWILFVDADLVFEPGFLNAAVGYAETNGLALVSFYLRPADHSVSERILLPLAVALYFCGVNPSRNRQAGFNGQCILARRDAYQFIGGHRAVLSSRNEDVKLAALAERHRLKIASVRATRSGQVRIRELRRTLERGGARFLMVTPWIGVMTLLAAVALALWLPAFAWLLADREWIPAGAFAIVPVALLWSWYRNWRAITAPFAIYFLLPLMVNGFAAALMDRRIQWRGRTI